MGQRIAVCLFCLFGCLGSPAWAQTGGASEGLDETFRTVKLPRDSELNVVVSKRKNTAPSAAVLLFAGYPGILKLRNDGGNITHDLAGNFLIRARRHLNTDNTFTVMVDCPLDQWSSCDDQYRVSEQHAADVLEVINVLKQDFGAQKIYVLGTSYGTVSSSFLARNLGDRIDGAIHSATFTDPRAGRHAHGTPMRSFDWSQARAPQLFVHHKDDPCDVTRYASIVERRKSLPLITVEGTRNPHGDACEAKTAHGFVGRERAVMLAIADWIVSRVVPPTIGGEN